MGFNERFTKKFCEQADKIGKNFSNIIKNHGFEGLESRLGKKTMDIIGGKVGRDLGCTTRVHTIDKITSDYESSPISFLISQFKKHMEKRDITAFSGVSQYKPNELIIITTDCVLNGLGRLCAYSTEFLREYLKADNIKRLCTIKEGAENCTFRLTYKQPLNKLTKEYFTSN